MADEDKKNDNAEPAEDGEGQVVGRLIPTDGIAPDQKQGAARTTARQTQSFQQAFLDTLAHKGEGLLTSHLYHDPSKEDDRKDRKKIDDTLIKHFGTLLYGANAWNANMQKNKNLRLTSGDMQALDHSLESHIVTKLPEKMHLFDYGAGGEIGAHKPEKLIRAILDDKTHAIGAYTAIDIVPRFASEAALAIYNEFNLHANIIVCDFMAAEKIAAPKIKDKEDFTPVSLLFGGILANAPDMSASGGNDSKENVVTYLSRMNRQFGTGSMVLMTFHAETDAKELLNEYQSTDELSAFVLSSFSRAVMQGTITDPSYDPFRYWRIVPRFNDKTKALGMCALSMEDHDIPTVKGPVPVRMGDAFTIALSYKWDENDYRPMFEKAGYDLVAVYRKEDAPRGVILARASRAPQQAPAP